MATKYLRRALALLVGLGILIGIIPMFGFSPLRAYADDLSAKVVLTDFDLIDKDGHMMDKDHANLSDYTNGLVYGGTYGMKVNFSVNKSANFTAGDTFTFYFPLLTNNPATVTDTDFYANIEGENKTIGTWSTVIEEVAGKQVGKVTITLNTQAQPYTQLTDAWVEIPIIGVSHTNIWGVDQFRDVTLGTITHHYKVNQRVPAAAVPLTGQSDRKYGAVGNNTSSVRWLTSSGYNLLNNLHAANGNPSASLTAPNIFVDTLEDAAGHKATAVASIEIGTNGVAPISLTDSTGNYNSQKYFVITSLFTRDDGAYPAYATLDAYVAALPKGHYGVYTAQDGTLSVVMNMGTLGVDTPLWSAADANYINVIADYAKYNGYYQDVSDTELRAAVEKIYGTGNGIGGRINYIGVSFTAEYPPSIVSVTYANTAHTTIAGDLPNVYTITPPNSGSNVEPYEIKVMKYDSVTGVAIPGVTVKLQIKNQDNSWSDTTGNATDTSQKVTDVNGVADWKLVPAGTYRVIEVAAAAGYELGTVDAAAGGAIATGEILVPDRTDTGHLMQISNVKIIVPTPQVGYAIAKFRTMDAPQVAGGNTFGFAPGTKGVTYKVAIVNTGEAPLTMDVEDVFTTGAENFEEVKVVGANGYAAQAFTTTASASLADITAMELTAPANTATKVNQMNGAKANVTIQPGNTLVIEFTADVKADAQESLDDTRADDVANIKTNTDGYKNTVSTGNVQATYGNPEVIFTVADFPVELAPRQDTAQTPVQKKAATTSPPSGNTPTSSGSTTPVTVSTPNTGDPSMLAETALTALAALLALVFVAAKKKSIE